VSKSLLVKARRYDFDEKIGRKTDRGESMTRIYLEQGKTKIVACALDWPGWCRFGRTEEAALSTLHASVPRYQVIAERADLEFTPSHPVIVERVVGDATTEWGAPSIITTTDTDPVDEVSARRGVALLQAAWKVMDEVVATSPSELRKGPHGGGRERDKVVSHVIDVERAYAQKIGVQHKPFPIDDLATLRAMRERIVAVLGQPSDGSPLAQAGWPTTYAIRRFTWHIIDHIWEI
jgi:hypothetical protein